MSDQAQRDELEKLVKACATRLVEHCDAVQIFVSRDGPNEGCTHHINYGRGNWFARYGHVKDWIIEVEEATRDKRRSKDEDDTD